MRPPRARFLDLDEVVGEHKLGLECGSQPGCVCQVLWYVRQ
jgi:hypothetical protein